jgi:membrane protease YdiL (CAAX protease family)
MLGRLLPFLATAALGAAQAFAWRAATPLSTWMILAAAVVPLAALSLLLLSREEVLADTFKVVPGDLSRGIGAAVAVILVLVGSGALCVRLAPQLATRELAAVLRVAVAVPVEWQRAAAVVAFAVLEEIVFRGAVTHALEERFGSARAPWVAGGFYVLATLPSLRAPLILAAVAISAVTAFVVVKWRRPSIAMVTHAAAMWVALEIVTPNLWQALARVQ